MASVVAPVFAPVALAPPAPPGQFDGVIATSAKAIELAPAEWLDAHARLEWFVVGAKTYAAAMRRSFAVGMVASNAALLARELRAEVQRRRFLYLAGRDRKPDLERTLGQAGFAIIVCEIYKMRARDAWSADEAQAVAGADAALHYSRRSAELATTLSERAGIGRRWRELVHVALSADAARPLEELGAKVAIAALPNETSLFEALTKL